MWISINTGLIASIDLLRARVEFQTQQQRLIAAENQVAIDKLTLARMIGLPNGQEFRLTDSVPYAALDGITQEQALQQALSARPDYLSAKAQVRAAELARQAVAAENYPTVSTNTNYGDIGSPNFGTSHGTLGFTLSVNVPIFQGSRVRADKLQADSALQQRKAELADLEGQIDDQVRTAFFNLKSSSELVSVAQSNIDLANQTLAQAQDRFRAGVADNLEVVQAQESVATGEPVVHQQPFRLQLGENLSRAGHRRCRAVRTAIFGSEITMATTTTPTPESGNAGGARPSATSLGAGRPSARRSKAGPRNISWSCWASSSSWSGFCCIATLPPGNPPTTRRLTATSIPSARASPAT